MTPQIPRQVPNYQYVQGAKRNLTLKVYSSPNNSDLVDRRQTNGSLEVNKIEPSQVSMLMATVKKEGANGNHDEQDLQHDKNN